MHPTRDLRPFALIVPFLLACNAPATPPPAPTPPATPPPAAEAKASDEPLLRTYAVPPEQARSLERALASALATGKETPPLGTVERLPDGRLVVVAPPGIQEGVAALLRDLDRAAAPPVRTAEFDYWIVLAEPAAAAEGVDAIPDIAPALQAIAGAQGPMKFSLVESMRLASLLDDGGEADGGRMRARQVVSEVGGRLVADLELAVSTTKADRPNLFTCSNGCSRFKSRVHVEPGQLLVIGQAGVEVPEGKQEHVRKTMFYIVRGQVRSGGA